MARKRKSKFDPYREKLEQWCSMGMTVKEMTDALNLISDEDFYDQGVYAYIYTHKIRYTSVYNRKVCDKCENCHTYTNMIGNKGRICSRYWRVIQPNVTHSPMWCEHD